MDWEFEVNKCKLLHIEWINNKSFCIVWKLYSIFCEKPSWKGIFLKKESVGIYIYIYTYIHTYIHTYTWASLVAQTEKNLPAMSQSWVHSLGWEDPLEEGMTTHSSILAWRIPWTEDPGRLHSMGSQRVRHD